MSGSELRNALQFLTIMSLVMVFLAIGLMFAVAHVCTVVDRIEQHLKGEAPK